MFETRRQSISLHSLERVSGTDDKIPDIEMFVSLELGKRATFADHGRPKPVSFRYLRFGSVP